jgi:7,8-dihydro-6-hydroxymethylpterin-pyrophosphokinase
MKNICCLIFHLKLPLPLLKNRQFVLIKLTFNPKTIGYWGGKQIVYFLIKVMVALDGKLSNRYFSLNTLKV